MTRVAPPRRRQAFLGPAGQPGPAPRGTRLGGRHPNGALVRVEARHLARSPLLWLGVTLGAALVALEMSWYLPALAGDDVIAYRGGGFLVSGGAVLAGAWLALRDRTTGAAELVAVTPTAPWRPWRARLLGVAATAAGVFAGGFVVAMALSAARGGRGAPDLRLLADGMLAVALGGWVGVAVGRVSGSRMVAVLAAPVWVVLSVLVATLGQSKGPSLSVQHLAPVLNLLNRSAAYGFLPDPLWLHLGYLLGLTLVVGAVLVALVSRGGRPVGLRPLLAVAAAGLVVSGTAGAGLVALPDAVRVLGPDRRTWEPVEGPVAGGAAVDHRPGWSFPADGHARTCVGDTTLTACVYPAYGRRLARELHQAAAPVAAVLAGLPGVPTRIRMVPAGSSSCAGGEVQLPEAQLRERSTQSDQQLRWRYVGFYLDCALGLGLGLGGGHPAGGEANEAVGSWALLAGGLLTREQVAHEAEAGLPSSPAAAAALAMAAVPAGQVRAELAPRWERLRAGTLPLAELPGQRP